MGEIPEGERFSGRSLMSSQYKVSPETIRRALGLLAEMGVVTIKPQAGAVVESRERAAAYVEQYSETVGIRLLQQELNGLLNERRALDGRIEDAVQKLVDMTERFRNSRELQTYEFVVPRGARLDGMTIARSAFRTTTGATIVAIRRGAKVTLSPMPDEVILAGDVLVTVCGPLLMPVVSEFIKQMG
ncbi:MAG: GntR family transcriptional regulator [Clostridiales bacterium]|nr:GntR family transcriptional regulator [Clostridiales bacterium]